MRVAGLAPVVRPFRQHRVPLIPFHVKPTTGETAVSYQNPRNSRTFMEYAIGTLAWTLTFVALLLVAVTMLALIRIGDYMSTVGTMFT